MKRGVCNYPKISDLQKNEQAKSLEKIRLIA